MRRFRGFLLKFYLFLVIIESAVTFLSLALLPTDTKNAIFVGYSLYRLILLLIVSISFVVSVVILYNIYTSPFFRGRFVDDLLQIGLKRKFFVSISLILLITCILFFLIPSEKFRDFTAAFERLVPLICYCGILTFQNLIVLFFWSGRKLYIQNLGRWKILFAFAGVIFGAILILALWITWSGVGVTPEVYGWHFPGTPILFSQLIVAILCAILFILFWEEIENRFQKLMFIKEFHFEFNTIIFFLLWLTAFLVWRGEPLREHSYFTPKYTPPNFQYYPYSDAAFYDTTSQIILIGQGREQAVILRPLYVSFLAILHLVAGQNYEWILTLQTLCLAVMPALVFFVVSLLGNRYAGLMSAILIIFREKNALALTNVIEVSHSRLLLSDMATMALVVFLVYAFVNWQNKTDQQHYRGVIAGASFGLLVLVRSQAQLLFPVMLICIVILGRWNWWLVMQRSLVFILGFLIVVSPWVWRNYEVTGKPAIENTEFYLRLFAGAYSEPADSIDILPGETSEEYNNRIKLQIIQYIFNHPDEIARVYMTYFIHNEIVSVVYLPMSLKLYDVHSYVKHTPFWADPLINLANGYGVMFSLSIGFIALGVGVAWQRRGFLGVVPLLIHFAYSFSIVLARISGWRFVLPVDWIPMVYYCIGLIQLINIVVSVVWNKAIISDNTFNEEKVLSQTSFLSSQQKIYPTTIGFLVIGLILPFIELIFPLRYPPLSNDKLIENYAMDGLVVGMEERISVSGLKDFLETEPDAVVEYGRALYPSYYEKGEFWGDASPNLIEASLYSRLQFSLIGPKNEFVFLPMMDVPKYFPHASDVLLIGCQQPHSVKALIVIVDDRFLMSTPWVGLKCSVME